MELKWDFVVLWGGKREQQGQLQVAVKRQALNFCMCQRQTHTLSLFPPLSVPPSRTVPFFCPSSSPSSSPLHDTQRQRVDPLHGPTSLAPQAFGPTAVRGGERARRRERERARTSSEGERVKEGARERDRTRERGGRNAFCMVAFLKLMHFTLFTPMYKDS